MENDFKRLHNIHKRKEYTQSYDTRYVAEISHSGLDTFRVIKAITSYLLDMKVDDQFSKWDEKWLKILEKNSKETSLSLAEERTIDAVNKQNEIENLLKSVIGSHEKMDWDKYKNHTTFNLPNPTLDLKKEKRKIKEPSFPKLLPIPEKPLYESFKPKLSILDKALKPLEQKKIEKAKKLYKAALNDWKDVTTIIEKENELKKQEYQKAVDKANFLRTEIDDKCKVLETQWINKKEDFYNSQKIINSEIDEIKKSYFEKSREAIVSYCELVLNHSQYPDFIPIDFELDYNRESKMLIVEYMLPPPDSFPTVKEVRYIISRKEIKETHFSQAHMSKVYDNAIYNITLRTLYELFESDYIDAIDIIVFNGWVKSINKATGKEVTNCIVSIQCKKEEFKEINLSHVDPKVCFKSLKGVGSSKLSGMTAIKPILRINKSDKRFVSSYEVANKLDESSNLALMDWEDFEHLIREIFEKEFSSDGGEVKVTQASRDGGVDAIAFDPDPIRGGKIVIQAKRYTNTVGVSAVRDLYGTVMNEGAIKGILVTTADYGPDAYEFAKNKPLTLMNGANLLYLLEKHGQKARIDIGEAKRLQNE